MVNDSNDLKNQTAESEEGGPLQESRPNDEIMIHRYIANGIAFKLWIETSRLSITVYPLYADNSLLYAYVP